jgi:hypothetical protein
MDLLLFVKIKKLGIAAVVAYHAPNECGALERFEICKSGMTYHMETLGIGYT